MANKIVTESELYYVLKKINNMNVAGDAIQIVSDATSETKQFNVLYDGTTITLDGNKLSVPIDNDTVYLDGGQLKSKGTVQPGNGLEFDATDPSKLNVKYDDKTITLQGTGTASSYIALNYDGKSIYWDEDATVLRARQVKAAVDGAITCSEYGNYQLVSVNVDDDTVKIVNNKLTATAQVPSVDSETIILVGNKLSVPIDRDTIIISEGKVKATALAKAPLSRVNGKLQLDYNTNDFKVKSSELALNLSGSEALSIENGTVKVSTDDKTIKQDTGKLYVPIDSETIIYNQDKDWIEVSHSDLVFDDGLYVIDSETETHVGVLVDCETIFINSLGQLQGAPNVLVDNKTIKQDTDHTISVNIDSETIVYNSEKDWIEVANVDVTFKDGLYIQDSEDGSATVGVLVDCETIFINEDGKLQGAPNVLVDGKTIKQAGDHTISVNIDSETIVYNSEKDWIEVNNCDVEGENGVYLRDDANKIYIGTNYSSLFAADSEVDLKIDHETIVYNSEKDWIEVPSTNIAGENGVYIRDTESETYIGIKVDGTTIKVNSEGSLSAAAELKAGKGIIIDSENKINAYPDSETIYVDETDNKLKTYIGGGYTGAAEPIIIATRTNSVKRRNYERPEYDEAEYVLDTVYFPSTSEFGNTIDAVVECNSAIVGTSVALTFSYVNGTWIGYTDNNDRIVVGKTETVVTCDENFDTAPNKITCTVETREKFREIAYVDNTFIKVDGETVYVNSEGALAAKVKDLVSGTAISIENSEVSVLYNSEYIKITDNKLDIKADDIVSEDKSTIKRNDSEKLEVQTDRGLDISTGKVGHTNSIIAKTVGDEITVPRVTVDEYGHITDIVGKSIPNYVGATASKIATAGFVPPAKATERNYFLRGDGTWVATTTEDQFEIRTVEQTINITSEGAEYTFYVSDITASSSPIAPLGWVTRRLADLPAISFITATISNNDQITLYVRGNRDASIVLAAQWLCVKF